MNRRSRIVLGASLAAAAPAAVSVGIALASPTVTVEVKSLSKTLLVATGVRGEKGWITKGGTPSGKCSGVSAAGALDAATHGRWTGKYYASVSGIFISSILGVKPHGKDYWSFSVNGKPSSKGICSVPLHAGQTLTFSIVK